jgi:hypothetical protein
VIAAAHVTRAVLVHALEVWSIIGASLTVALALAGYYLHHARTILLWPAPRPPRRRRVPLAASWPGVPDVSPAAELGRAAVTVPAIERPQP